MNFIWSSGKHLVPGFSSDFSTCICEEILSYKIVHEFKNKIFSLLFLITAMLVVVFYCYGHRYTLPIPLMLHRIQVFNSSENVTLDEKIVETLLNKIIWQPNKTQIIYTLNEQYSCAREVWQYYLCKIMRIPWKWFQRLNQLLCFIYCIIIIILPFLQIYITTMCSSNI